MIGFLAFRDKYKDEPTCIQALADLKWPDGFRSTGVQTAPEASRGVLGSECGFFPVATESSEGRSYEMGGSNFMMGGRPHRLFISFQDSRICSSVIKATPCNCLALFIRLDISNRGSGSFDTIPVGNALSDV